VPNKRIGKNIIKTIFISCGVIYLILDSIYQTFCAPKKVKKTKKKRVDNKDDKETKDKNKSKAD